MEAQDKFGRDLAAEFELISLHMFNGDQEKLEILKNTKLYKFFSGKVHHPGFTASNGIDKFKPRTTKVRCTPQRSKLLLKLVLDRYLIFEIISAEEHQSLMSMAESCDGENLVLAETLCEIKHRPKYKRIFNKIKNENRKNQSPQHG